MKSIAIFLTALVVAVSAQAKLPAPVLDDAAKAKAAEAAAKKAYDGKMEAYNTCKAQDKAAAHYRRTAKGAKPAVATPPCAKPSKV